MAMIAFNCGSPVPFSPGTISTIAHRRYSGRHELRSYEDRPLKIGLVSHPIAIPIFARVGCIVRPIVGDAEQFEQSNLGIDLRWAA